MSSRSSDTHPYGATSEKDEPDTTSNTTARRNISEMCKDILDKAVEKTITCPYFGLQLDGSADAASCAQLLVYARYLKGDSVKGICSPNP
jgi:hypothetical protein